MNPALPNRGIDHLVLCVADLPKAAAFYERLGFTLTPPARHPFGTGNQIAQLQGTFLELLTVMDESAISKGLAGQFSFAGFNRDYLAKREGISMLVFESADARADQVAFTNDGLETYPTFDFQRQAKLPDGNSVTVGFSLTFVTDPRMPDGVFFCCQQHAPQYFWKADYQRHANGAQSVAQVIMVADEPADFADLFRKLQAPDRVTATEGQLTVTTARGHIIVLAPERFSGRFPASAYAKAPSQPHFAGYQIAVDSIGRTRSLLERNSVAFQDASDATGAPTVQIAPESAFGTVIEFTEAAR